MSPPNDDIDRQSINSQLFRINVATEGGLKQGVAGGVKYSYIKGGNFSSLRGGLRNFDLDCRGDFCRIQVNHPPPHKKDLRCKVYFVYLMKRTVRVCSHPDSL